jgi:hypothetical protein
MTQQTTEDVVFKRPAFAFENLAPVPNTILRNPKLTAGEKGILAYLLSHQAGYALTMKQLQAENKGGWDTLNTQLKGLEKAGYLRRTRLRDSQGRLGRYSWELTIDEWGNPTSSDSTTQGNPPLAVTCENEIKPQVGTSPGFPIMEKPDAYKTTNLKNTKEEDKPKEKTSSSLPTQASKEDLGDELPPINAKPEKPKTQRRASRISPDFAVTDEMVAWAQENVPQVDGRYETSQFVDYWLGRSGAVAAKLDWVAAWRTWMRKAHKDSVSRRGTSGFLKPGGHTPYRNPVDASAYEGAF